LPCGCTGCCATARKIEEDRIRTDTNLRQKYIKSKY